MCFCCTRRRTLVIQRRNAGSWLVRHPDIKNAPLQHLCSACSCPHTSLTVFLPPALIPVALAILIACFPTLLAPPTVPFLPLRALFISLAQRVEQGAPKNSDPRYAGWEGTVWWPVSPPRSPFTFSEHMEVLEELIVEVVNEKNTFFLS